MAAWLIKRFVDPLAELAVQPVGSAVDEDAGIAFDVPGSRYVRTPDRCVSERVLAETGRSDEALKQIVGFIRKLEIAYWMTEPDSPAGRLNRSLMEIYERHDTLEARLKGMFAYLDRVHAAGGVVP